LQIKLGEVIKAKREEKKISLVNFAKEVGISPGYLSQLENGKKENPKLEVILKISEQLGIELNMLLGLEKGTEGANIRLPSLLGLVIAKDRNMKVLQDREVQRKICSILERAIESRYLIEDSELYNLFLEDIYVQMETALKRYMSMEILISNK